MSRHTLHSLRCNGCRHLLGAEFEGRRPKFLTFDTEREAHECARARGWVLGVVPDKRGKPQDLCRSCYNEQTGQTNATEGETCLPT